MPSTVVNDTGNQQKQAENGNMIPGSERASDVEAYGHGILKSPAPRVSSGATAGTSLDEDSLENVPLPIGNGEIRSNTNGKSQVEREKVFLG